MAKYEFQALDAKGKEVEGEVDAASEQEVLVVLKERGYFPTNVAALGLAKGESRATYAGAGHPERGRGLSAEIPLPAFMIHVPSKLLATYTRQLSTLISAGLPLVKSLRVLYRQEQNSHLKKATFNMADAIEGGSSFAEALAQQPRIFNKLYINMVKAGEVGGVLDQVLASLADFMEKAERIKAKVFSAMVYPLAVLAMAGGILFFLMAFIIPKFEEVFADILGGQELPKLTQVVMASSEFLKTHTLMTVVIIMGLVLGVQLLALTGWGRQLLDTMKFRAPIFGGLIQKTTIARFSRTLGTLLTAGVPVLQALNIVRDTVANAVVSGAVSKVHDAVKEGEAMAQPLDGMHVFPPLVVSMIEVGEETGQVPEMLMKIADAYDDEVDHAVVRLTSILEPLLIVLLALIVGTIVVALFIPLVSIIGNLS